MPGRAEDAVERLGVLLQCLRILTEHLAHADDGIERGAQLVVLSFAEGTPLSRLRLTIAGCYFIVGHWLSRVRGAYDNRNCTADVHRAVAPPLRRLTCRYGWG